MKKTILAIITIIILYIAFTSTKKIQTKLYSYIYNRESKEITTSNYIYSDNILYLTFDDGPNRKYTPILLDYLKEEKIKATFFLIGSNIEGNEDLVKRIYDEGHTIGVHCYNHKLYTKMKNEKVLEDIEKCSSLIYNITGEKPVLLRPPYGSLNDRVKKIIDLDIILWNVDSLDWKYRNEDKIYNRVTKSAKPGFIILMHDSFKTSIEATKLIVSNYKQLDYVFLPIKKQSK